ncbi:anosmin-1 Kallmann syndrome 1 [Choristoneura fumiferana]|uniref:anosmin-1 Kallmann syndrome 1 n=1 Tax=Choristoneura fumiferana TaxID=7141 RepID=UPI003D154739
MKIKMGLKMHNIVGLLVIVFLIPLVLSKSKKLSKLQTNPLSKARCDLMCFDVIKQGKAECRSQCRLQEQRPGTCPSSDSPEWAAACVKACNLDSQCDGTQRCCHHGCGSTCSEPVDLFTLPGLPALPTIEEVKEKRKSVRIRWSDGVGDLARAVPGRILYLLEEQHHIGPKYEEERLGGWNLLLRTNKTKASLRNLLKPGRYYRFRAAAVSSAGSRGFSDPSAPFNPRKGPRPPPPPKRLRVRPVGVDNGTVTIRLEWKEPNSDLPVMRYKVFWSRRVRGVTGDLDSVLVNHQSIPKDQTHTEIRDLKPNSMYFLQVQTISHFGVGKLRSEKAAIFYNTTNIHDLQPQSLQRRDKKFVNGLKLHKVVWQNNRLKAHISWTPIPGDQVRRYFVQWRTIKCEDLQNENKSLSATTEQTSFEIYELDYHCTYKVNVSKSRKTKIPDSELMIIVPDCEYFQKRMNNTYLSCQT